MSITTLYGICPGLDDDQRRRAELSPWDVSSAQGLTHARGNLVEFRDRLAILVNQVPRAPAEIADGDGIHVDPQVSV